MMIDPQRILRGGGEANLNILLEEAGVRRPFLLCGKSFRHLPCAAWKIAASPRFDGVRPNPDTESLGQAIAAFRASGCDGLVAVGGGSALDTAKGVKAFYETGIDLTTEITPNALPLIAVPTTAGSGSESTHFAVLYQEGVKHSVSHPSLRPAAVLLEGGLLKTLPDYQKKCTFLDALCQAIESHWSRKATPESRALAERAIRELLTARIPYLAGDAQAAQRALEAANLAGQAIDHTTTTAPHAMSYKLTGLYGVPHGHAVALCLPLVWRHMAERGDAAVRRELDCLSGLLGGDGAETVEGLLREMEMPSPRVRPEDVPLLAASVNAQRLQNNPLPLDGAELRALYAQLASAV